MKPIGAVVRRLGVQVLRNPFDLEPVNVYKMRDWRDPVSLDHVMIPLTTGFREFMREVIVPIAVAGIAAYAVIKAAMVESEGKPDVKADEDGTPDAGASCGCGNRKPDDTGDVKAPADGSGATQ